MNSSNDLTDVFVTCPHCEYLVGILQINCRIFRHAVYIGSGIQVNPHLPKNECDTLVSEGKVYGCCKPFELVTQDNVLVAIACEYK